MRTHCVAASPNLALPRRPRRAAWLLLLAFALAACGDDLRRSRGSDARVKVDAPATCAREGQRVAAIPVAKVLGAATLVTSPPGDPRLFVLEQEGRIRILSDGEPLPAPFLDLRDNIGGPVQAGGEQGLLGLAFHPRFADNGLLYIYHSARGANLVASYRVSAADRDRGDPASREVILFMGDRFANHNGGMIEFGKDGYLYIGTGDGGSANDPDGNGQNPFSLLGKMLRLDVDHPSGGRAYGIPADNPFADGAAGAPEVYTLGLRNPWRWSFDDDTLYLADVGQDRHEELDVLPTAAARGANLGWKTYEAQRCAVGTCDPTGMVFPQLVRNHGAGAGNGWCSIIGGAVYRGTCSPGMVGRYYFTDYCKGGLFSLRWTGAEVTDVRQEEGAFPAKISSIYPAAGGELYVTTTDGEIFRLEAKP
ncbi:MAG: PQQ-dependent sugar dehydrogenase [Kofleriaceae bacterium]